MKKDILFYSFSNFFLKFIIGVSSILLARIFTKEDFGLLKIITTYLGFISIFVNFGQNDFLLFHLSKRKKKFLKKVISNFLYLYILYFPIFIITYFFIYTKGLLVAIIFYVKFFFDWIIDVINRYFQAKNKFINLSILLFISGVFLFIPVIWIYRMHGDLLDYVFFLMIFTILCFSLYLLIFYKNENISLKFDFLRFDILTLKWSFPFFLSNLTVYIYMQSDILMISILKSSVEVSRYAVATTLIFAAYLIPNILYNYFLPKLIKDFKNYSKLKNIYKRFLIYTIFASLPIFFILFFLPKEIIVFLFGSKYSDSYLILKILAVVFLFHSLCFVFGAFLTASGNQTLRSKIQFIAALTNIILNLFFIPLYGAEGAAFTTAITEIIIFSAYIIYNIHLQKSIFNCSED